MFYSQVFDSSSYENCIFTGNTKYAKAQLLELGRRLLAGSRYYISLKDIKKKLAEDLNLKINLAKSQDIFKGLKVLADLVLHPKKEAKIKQAMLPFLLDEIWEIPSLFSLEFPLKDWLKLIPYEWVEDYFVKNYNPRQKRASLFRAKFDLICRYFNRHSNPARTSEAITNWITESINMITFDVCNNQLESSNSNELLWGTQDKRAYEITARHEQTEEVARNRQELVKNAKTRFVLDRHFKNKVVPILNKLNFKVSNIYNYQTQDGDFCPHYKYEITTINRQDIGWISPQVDNTEFGFNITYLFYSSNGFEYQVIDLSILEKMLNRNFPNSCDDPKNFKAEMKLFKQETIDFEKARGW